MQGLLSTTWPIHGIADSASNVMLHWILPESGIPVVGGTVQRVTHLEKQMDANKDSNGENFNQFV